MIFATNAETMIATKTLKDAGLTPRLVAKPPDAKSASNLCLTIERAMEAAASTALRAARLTPSLV